MRGLRGQLKGTEGQGLVNFELLKLDEAGSVAKLKDVGFNPNKGLAYGDELGELDFAKITKDQADQIIALGKEKIDLELLRKVLPSKLKNIVNPTPLSRHYEAGGRVGFRDGTEVKTLETQIKNDLKEIGKYRLKKIFDGSKATKPEIGIIKKIMGGTGKFLGSLANPLEWIKLKNWIGPQALAFFGVVDAGIAGYDHLEKGTPWKEAASNTLLGLFMKKDSLEYQVEDPNLQKHLTPGAKNWATGIKLIGEYDRLQKEFEEMNNWDSGKYANVAGVMPKRPTPREFWEKRKELEKKRKRNN